MRSGTKKSLTLQTRCRDAESTQRDPRQNGGSGSVLSEERPVRVSRAVPKEASASICAPQQQTNSAAATTTSVVRKTPSSRSVPGNRRGGHFGSLNSHSAKGYRANESGARLWNGTAQVATLARRRGVGCSKKESGVSRTHSPQYPTEAKWDGLELVR